MSMETANEESPLPGGGGAVNSVMMQEDIMIGKIAPFYKRTVAPAAVRELRS
jgi:hypothetical protein